MTRPNPRRAEAEALLISGEGANVVADRLGIARSTVGWWRYELGTKGRLPRRSLDDDAPHCPRCGLRGEHRCLSSAAEMATRRRGHWTDEHSGPTHIGIYHGKNVESVK